VLDGILFEKQGIPAAAIVTAPFVETGEAMARSWGVSGYRFISIPHPIANLTDEELDRRARDVVSRVVDLLVEGDS
jgi:hypothetical protein